MNVNEIASLGSNVKPVIQNENCSVLMLNDATGEGVMTVYRVMPGVMICFSDMHMEQCASEFELKNDRKIFCIDHCREGRIEILSCAEMLYLRYNKHCQSVRGSRLIPSPSFSPCTHNAWREAASIQVFPLPNSSIYCVLSS